ncbi:ATP-binding protein [Flavobacteriaceae bacterium D16]|nr:ATP-binding protein [Flavobacteriaceae bacterium D16]
MLYRMAIQQQKARAYIESENTTYAAINLIEPIKDTIQLFLCYNNLGSVTKELKEYDRSLEFYNKAKDYLNIMEESDKAYYTRTLNNNLGNVYKEQEMWEEAIPYFEAALQYENLESNLPRSYAQTLNNLTISRFLNGDTTNVLDDLFKALKIFTLEDDNAGISLVSYNLAVYYANIGNKKEALFYAADAIEKAELSSNYKRKLEALKLLGWVDPQNDLYFDEYVMLSERLQDEERAIRDKFARIERETDEALAEAESLAKERQIIMGVSLGLILLGIASLIIIFQRIRVQRLRFQQQQQEANQEIFNLMLSQKQKMEEGKQSEQKRISEELHDGVLGALNGIRMVLLGLNGKNDDSAVAMRGDAIDKLKGVQEEIRSISHELNDAAYQKFNNFINSLQDLIKETQASSNLSIKLNYDEDVDWDTLSGEIKINLYRIIQESIQNVVKHAQANQIELNLIPWDNMLKITISDDGRGFDTRKMKKGIGHRNIKSRVEKINGSWNIESTIGKGSHITVILPYEKEVSQTNMLVNEAGELQEIKKD